MNINKFSVPNSALDLTTIEQAALNDAIVVTPIYGDSRVVEAMRFYAKDTGLTYSDGTEIEVLNWEEMKFYKNGIKTNKSIVFYQPTDILLEMFDARKYETITLVEYNDCV